MIHIILSSSVNTPPGGIDQFCLYLCDYFEKKDVEYRIYYIGDAPLDGHEKSSNYLEVNGSPKVLWFLVGLMKKIIMGEVKFRKKDTIIVNRTEVAALLFPFVKCKKRIQFIHGSSAYAVMFWSRLASLVHLFAERLAIAFSTKTAVLLANKDYGLPYYKKKYPKSANKIVYSNLPISTVFAKSMNVWRSNSDQSYRSENLKIIIGYHGRLVDNPKRILDYLDVLGALIDYGFNARLCLIGGGSDVEAIKAKSQLLGLENRVEITGALSGQKLVDSIQNLDVFVLLSRFEGICLSTLEAAALGVPVVSTKVGDVSQYLKDGLNGIFIDVDYDIEDVVSAIVKASELEQKPNPYLDNYSLASFEEIVGNILEVNE